LSATVAAYIAFIGLCGEQLEKAEGPLARLV
jgi:hypothetical protein